LTHQIVSFATLLICCSGVYDHLSLCMGVQPITSAWSAIL